MTPWNFTLGHKTKFKLKVTRNGAVVRVLSSDSLMGLILSSVTCLGSRLRPKRTVKKKEPTDQGTKRSPEKISVRWDRWGGEGAVVTDPSESLLEVLVLPM